MTGPGGSVLIVAHPGHELLIHGWVAAARPVAMVLTDGSGSDGMPRIAATHALLDRLGAIPGPIFGAHSDRQVYAALLARDAGFFRAIVDRIVAALADRPIAAIVSDAIEHFNPTHDLAHAIADAAAGILGGASGRPVARYEFALEHPQAEPVPSPRDVVVRLDALALAAKQAAADAYLPLGGLPLAGEIVAHRARGLAAYEHLRCVASPYPWPPQLDASPFYETFGARRIREGRYGQLITYRDHVRPTALALLGATMPLQL